MSDYTTRSVMTHVVDVNMDPLCKKDGVNWRDKALTVAAAESGHIPPVCPECRRLYIEGQE